MRGQSWQYGCSNSRDGDDNSDGDDNYDNGGDNDHIGDSNKLMKILKRLIR